MRNSKGMRPSARSRALAAVGVVGLLLVAGCGDDSSTDTGSAASASEGDGGTTSVKVATLPFVDDAPFFLGDSKGYFEEAGLSVSSTPVPSGDNAVATLISGENQFAFSNIVTVLIARSKGLPLQIIAGGDSASRDEKGHFAIVVPKDSPIRSLKDLAGKTVAVSTLTADLGPLTVQNVIRKAGVDPAQVKLTEVGFPDMQPALERDAVDAAVVIEPFLTAAEGAGMRAISYPFTETRAGLEIAAWVTTDAYAKEHPDVVQKFQEAIQRSNAYAADNPDELRDAVLEYTEIPAPVAETMNIPGWSEQIDVTSIELIGKLANEFGQLDEVPPTDEVLAEGA